MGKLSTHICQQCRSKLSSHSFFRSLATSARLAAIPPESPNYIDVPQSHQPDLFTPIRQKGLLPVPREIFPPRQPDKPSEEYIARATRDKSAKNVVPEEKMSELNKHRSHISAMRKRHLSEGLTELYDRKQTMTKQVAFRSELKRKERDRLINQPERMDDQLTSATLPLVMQPMKTLSITPEEAQARYERKKANLEKHNAAKAEQRRNALHSLYMNARDFITTEEQLDAEIEKVFPTGNNPAWRTDASEGDNIWNRGAPPTIAEMLEASSQRVRREYSHAGHKDAKQKFRLDQERMKRIAEELSGGRI